MKNIVLLSLLSIGIFSCKSNDKAIKPVDIQPVVITEKTMEDTDDPAIWYNSENPAASLILGTDKHETNGGIYVYNLDGKIDWNKSITKLQRPNNIDIGYALVIGGKERDIAVFTERGRNMIRVLSIPDFKFIDNGGIPVFENDSFRSPMGVALYKDKQGDIFAIVSRKDGPKDGYLHQYQLIGKDSIVVGKLIRAFGKFSGKKEIESIAVDNDAGIVYYSDETVGVRKYYADASKGNQELALFGTDGFKQDNEGISIFRDASEPQKGFIIVSDQQANMFRMFNLSGTPNQPNQHDLVRIVKTKTNESDGSELLAKPLNNTFKKGIFVAMSDDKTFHFYRLEDVIGD